MSVIYVYPIEATYLVEAKDVVTISQIRSFVGTSQFHDAFLGKCEEICRVIKGSLKLAHVFYGDRSFSGKKGSHSKARIIPDLDSYWGDTIPVPPTAMLSGAFATLPLVQVTSSAATGDGKLSVEYAYQFESFQHTQSHHRNGVSQWGAFLAVASSLIFGITPDERSRFTLEQYIARASMSGGAQSHSVLSWSEEHLWRLFNALISALAVFHSKGFHFGGHINLDDILCFMIPETLSSQLENTILSMKGDRHAVDTDVLIKTIANSVVLPEVSVTADSSCHRTFFVLNRIPHSLFVDNESPEDMQLAQRRDIESVGKLVLSVVETRDRAFGNSGHGASSELLFLLKRISEDSGSDVTTSAQVPTAVSLTQLQALRLRVSAWHYQLLAEESQRRLSLMDVGRHHHHRDSVAHIDETDKRRHQHLHALEAVLRERAEGLENREKSMAEREKKLNTLLELYELTHEHLNMLPSSGSAGYDQLREQLSYQQPLPVEQKEDHIPTSSVSSQQQVPSSANNWNPNESSLPPLDISPLAKASDDYTMLGEDNASKLAASPAEGESNNNNSESAGQGNDGVLYWNSSRTQANTHAKSTPPHHYEPASNSPAHTPPANRHAHDAAVFKTPENAQRGSDSEADAQNINCTPKRPYVDSLGRNDLSSHSKYSSILSAPPVVAGVEQNPEATPMMKSPMPFAAGSGGSGKKPGFSPRSNNNEWIRSQYDTLAALRVSFQQSTVAVQASGDSRSARASPRKSVEVMELSLSEHDSPPARAKKSTSPPTPPAQQSSLFGKKQQQFSAAAAAATTPNKSSLSPRSSGGGASSSRAAPPRRGPSSGSKATTTAASSVLRHTPMRATTYPVEYSASHRAGPPPPTTSETTPRRRGDGQQATRYSSGSSRSPAAIVSPRGRNAAPVYGSEPTPKGNRSGLSGAGTTPSSAAADTAAQDLLRRLRNHTASV